MTEATLKRLTIGVIMCCLGTLPVGEVARAQSDVDSRTSFDLLFLAADAPLWFVLKMEGARDGIHTVRQRYAELIIESVDTDDDGFADATEAARLPADGRMGANSKPLGEGWVEFDRSETDGRLSAQEYLAAIDSLIGPVFTTRRKPPQLAQSVQLLSRLDQNDDGRISTSEISLGTGTLIPFDFDDDGTFSPAELQPFPQAMVDMAMADELGVEAQPFVPVDATTDQEELLAQLYAKYALESGIPPERSGLSEFAFGECDLNTDGWLSRDEAQALLRPRPVAEIGIDLPAGKVTLRRSQRGARVELLPAESSRRLVLRLGSEIVEFSARDNRFEAFDQINLLKTQFLRGDRDKNGYMDPREFVSLAGMDATFEDVDADGDGKLVIDELDRFVRLDAYLTQCAVEMEVEPREKPLFAILDTNLDRRLTAREFADGTQRLQEFDADADGLLDARELELLRKYRVRFAYVVPPAVRPEYSMSMMSQRRLPVVRRTSRSGPEWFLNMDRNQDGDVTWREFLGPRKAFESLDTDGSGWIDETEARSPAS